MAPRGSGVRDQARAAGPSFPAKVARRDRRRAHREGAARATAAAGGAGGARSPDAAGAACLPGRDRGRETLVLVGIELRSRWPSCNEAYRQPRPRGVRGADVSAFTSGAWATPPRGVHGRGRADLGGQAPRWPSCRAAALVASRGPQRVLPSARLLTVRAAGALFNGETRNSRLGREHPARPAPPRHRAAGRASWWHR